MSSSSGISNYELADLAKKHKINLKLENIIMKDELTNFKLKNKMNFIVNLQSTNKSGTHWVALIIRKKYALYCDSYGVIPDTSILKYCVNNNLHLGYNNYIFQDLFSTNCGLYAFALIKYIEMNRMPRDKIYENNLYELGNNFVNLFVGKTKQNDSILKQFLKIHKN